MVHWKITFDMIWYCKQRNDFAAIFLIGENSSLMQIAPCHNTLIIVMCTVMYDDDRGLLKKHIPTSIMLPF